jgi:hypothetical protein
MSLFGENDDQPYDLNPIRIQFLNFVHKRAGTVVLRLRRRSYCSL